MHHYRVLLQQIEQLLFVFRIEAHVSHDMVRRLYCMSVANNGSLPNCASARKKAALLSGAKKLIPLLPGGLRFCISMNEQKVFGHFYFAEQYSTADR